MFDKVTTGKARTAESVLAKLTGHYEKIYPGTEICIIYRKAVYHILSDGKLKESINYFTIYNTI